MSDPLAAPGVAIVYDGECPLCAAYTRRLRLEAAAAALRLIDARRDAALRRQLTAEGFDLDRGMVVTVDGVRYHGARAMNVLALMSGPSGLFNRLNHRLFANPVAARALYPALTAGRRVLLALLGRRPLDDAPSPNRS